MVRKCDHTHTYNRRNLLHLSPCGWAGCSKEPPSHFLRHQDTQIVSHVSNVSSKRREHYSHCRAKWVCSISPWSCYLVASTFRVALNSKDVILCSIHASYLVFTNSQNSTWDLRIQPEMTSLTKRSTRKLKKTTCDKIARSWRFLLSANRVGPASFPPWITTVDGHWPLLLGWRKTWSTITRCVTRGFVSKVIIISTFNLHRASRFT